MHSGYTYGMINNAIVCHARKIKTAVGLANVSTHNSRLNIYGDSGELLDKPDWLTNLGKAHLNEGARHPPELILKRRNQAIKDAEKITLEDGFKWRKPQKNAATAVEFNISASPEWFENKKSHEIKAYFDSCREFIEKRYGSKNLLNWATHYDEKTPHLHILMTPLIKTDKGIKYSSSDFLGGKNGLQELQTEIYNAVGKKYGLNRGVEGSKARHTDQAEYLASMKAKELTLQKKEQELSAKEKKIKEIISKSSPNIPDFKPELQKKPLGSFMYSFNLSNGETTKNWELYEAKETALQAVKYAKKLKSALQESNLQKNHAIEAAQEQHKKAQKIESKYEYLVKELKNLKAEDLRKIADEKEIEEQKRLRNRSKSNDRDFYQGR